MKQRGYVLGLCSFLHYSAPKFPGVCIGPSWSAWTRGVGIPYLLLSPQSVLLGPDVSSGCSSKLCSFFSGPRHYLSHGAVQLGWEDEACSFFSFRGLCSGGHFCVCNLLTQSLLLVDSASKLVLPMVCPSSEPCSSTQWQGGEQWSLEGSLSDPLSLF